MFMYKKWMKSSEDAGCQWCLRHVDTGNGGTAEHDVVHITMLTHRGGSAFTFRFCSECVLDAYRRPYAGPAFTGNLLDMLDDRLLQELVEEAWS